MQLSSAISGDAAAWFVELRRLIDEAEERLAVGHPLSALSSLVAVPPLHRMLMDRCTMLLDDPNQSSESDELSIGLYL
ncbi:MAG: hypothetical protein AAB131_18775 [Actinomycetota bacterium]